MAQILDLADAVKTALNGHSFATAFTASRAYAPLFRLQDLASLQVVAVPHAQKGEIVDRKPTRQMEYQVDVGFAERFALPIDTSSQAQVDSLASLAEAVADFLIATPLSVGSPAVPAVATAVSNDPVWDPVKLKEEGVFLSVLTVSYAVFR